MSMIALAIRMLTHKPLRTAATVAGVSFAFFLSAAQIGLLVGWCHTTSALIRHAGVDLWVMAEQTPAYDYGTAISRNRIYQARSVPGVADAEGLFMAWNVWQRPDGRRVNIELVGLGEGLVGGPWEMLEGHVEVVQQPNTVIIDELYLDALGVGGIGDEVELIGRRARVGGISRGVRKFTASPFVFTSIEAAIEYDQRYRSDEITFVLVRCLPDHEPAEVRARLRDALDGVEVLTTAEFARRTIGYWMLETGVGITVVVTALLGFVVGAVITSQTLYGITTDHLEDYTTLLAVGVARWRLIGVSATQSLAIGGMGVAAGAVAFAVASAASARTPIPLETTVPIAAGLLCAFLSCCLAGALLSGQTVLRVDPASVFRN